MGELQILGLIFLVMCVTVVVPTIAFTAGLVEEDKEKEQRYRELTTISKEEGDIIRQILKQYKWKMMHSSTDRRPMGEYVNTAEIATSLATNYAKEFAALNGYDEDLIFKLYYMYNKAHGELYVEDTSYLTETVPAKRDILTGRITEGYTYEYNHQAVYHINFFILEKA